MEEIKFEINSSDKDGAVQQFLLVTLVHSCYSDDIVYPAMTTVLVVHTKSPDLAQHNLYSSSCPTSLELDKRLLFKSRNANRAKRSGSLSSL